MHYACSVNIEDIEFVTACELSRWGRVNSVLHTRTAKHLLIMETHDEVLRRIQNARDNSATDAKSSGT
jgi:hypothetical protein